MIWTIEDAKRVQRDLGLGEVHVAYIDLDEGFVIAHTDAERESGMDLHDCRYHYWLCKLDEPEWLPYIWDISESGWYSLSGLVPGTAKGLAL
jgi:hypothetical protein